ncbi:MAG: hypothetical protein OXH65_03540 [Paracoccaceae bacterium]|nr:hypothetical protein [Paracoccaceae bacterium]MDE2674160.1 hypothetical protein [Paracoccaceae bacterium]MDE2739596.1 hypothetical protein [Paracoccaceae bacterium]
MATSKNWMGIDKNALSTDNEALQKITVKLTAGNGKRPTAMG